MKKNDIERSLHRAVGEAPLLNFNTLVEAAVAGALPLDISANQKPIRASFFAKHLVVAASLCFALLLSATAWAVYDRLPAGTVSLDVNPSIVIVVNHRDRVLSVSAVNDDAQAILTDLEFPSRDLDETVDTILTALIEDGYLTQDTDVVLVSAGSKDSVKADQLAVTVEEQIKGYHSLEHASLTVLRQIISLDENAAEVAAQNGVSIGKMKLITKILEADSSLQAEDLMEMSVKDLMILARENQLDLGGTIKCDGGWAEETAKPNSSGADVVQHGNSQTAPTSDKSNNGKSEEEQDTDSQSSDMPEEARENASQNNGMPDEAQGENSQNNDESEEARENASQNNGISEEEQDNDPQNGDMSEEAQGEDSQSNDESEEIKERASDKNSSATQNKGEVFNFSDAVVATAFFL